MADRAIFRCVFVVTAHLTVAKYAYVVLMSEVSHAPQAHELVGIFPRNEMITEPLCDKEAHELTHGIFGTECADKEVLTSFVSHFRSDRSDKKFPAETK